MKLYRPDYELHKYARAIISVVVGSILCLITMFGVFAFGYWVVNTPILFLICKWLAALGLLSLVAFIIYVAVVKPE